MNAILIIGVLVSRAIFGELGVRSYINNGGQNGLIPSVRGELADLPV